jgi:hypothetical protein
METRPPVPRTFPTIDEIAAAVEEVSAYCYQFCQTESTTAFPAEEKDRVLGDSVADCW